ncbi:uncharacterized protein LOC135144200 [Zophobas morio]|uniref:uncharacterized protein LOC135144200 n=1 Tax=Zophobas morio TaxID=2755281 RepID=UPI0030829A41
MRQKYGSQWPLSVHEGQNLLAEAENYAEKLSFAAKADDSLKQECEKFYEYLNTLSNPEKILQLLSAEREAPRFSSGVYTERIKELYNKLLDSLAVLFTFFLFYTFLIISTLAG